MSDVFRLNEGDIEALQKRMAQAGEEAGAIVDGYLRESGADTIERNITDLLPVSGRRWKGKQTAAKKAKPFQRQFGSLSVTIKARKSHSYLYFPDDGGNTHKHHGGQHFMFRGAESARESILDGINDQLTATISE